MKTIIASAFVAALALGTLGATAADAAIIIVHHHHHHRVCTFRHHHRVCFWR